MSWCDRPLGCFQAQKSGGWAVVSAGDWPARASVPEAGNKDCEGACVCCPLGRRDGWMAVRVSRQAVGSHSRQLQSPSACRSDPLLSQPQIVTTLPLTISRLHRRVARPFFSSQRARLPYPKHPSTQQTTFSPARANPAHPHITSSHRTVARLAARRLLPARCLAAAASLGLFAHRQHG